MQRILHFLILLFIPLLAVAAEPAPHPALDLGHVAQNLMEPVGLFSDFVHSACFIIGASFLFACLIKYIEHRRSPLMVPISTVVFLFIAGVLLILLPFLSILLDNGVPYSLMK